MIYFGSFILYCLVGISVMAFLIFVVELVPVYEDDEYFAEIIRILIWPIYLFILLPVKIFKWILRNINKINFSLLPIFSDFIDEKDV